MPLRTVNIGENLGLRRGEAVVCVPVYGAEELFAECLASVLAHTEPDVPVLVCDDATPSGRIRPIIEETLAPRRLAAHHPLSATAAGTSASSPMRTPRFAPARPGDIVLLNSDCVVSEGWFPPCATRRTANLASQPPPRSRTPARSSRFPTGTSPSYGCRRARRWS